jgi:hypothetical protein
MTIYIHAPDGGAIGGWWMMAVMTAQRPLPQTVKRELASK